MPAAEKYRFGPAVAISRDIKDFDYLISFVIKRPERAGSPGSLALKLDPSLIK